MRFETFVDLVMNMPIIDAGVLSVIGGHHDSISVQISRWVRAGKLIRLARGRYLLPDRLRRMQVAPEYVANLLRTPSYVSLERALSIHGMIPESVPLVQSVTTGRPGQVNNSVGTFDYRHVKRAWFTGYRETSLGDGGSALVATPEKALLDLVYLSSGEFTPERIEELRLDDLARLDRDVFLGLARKSGSPRVSRAAGRILDGAGG